MSRWFEDVDGQYISEDSLAVLFSVEQPLDSGSWVINGIFRSIAFGGAVTTLAGTWPTQAAAQEAIRELIDGVDPSIYGD